MVKRQLRVGEIVEDYCPRERRLSDHAIVAMVDDDVRQVRCTACDGEHEYRGGKVPVTRRKKPAVAAPPLPPGGAAMSQPAPEAPPVEAVPALTEAAPADDGRPEPEPTDPPQPETNESAPADWPVHRQLIRAQLPRIEGQVPERKIPEFTMHNTGRPGGHGRPFRGGQGGPGRPGGGGGTRGASGHGRPGGGGGFSQGSRQGHGGAQGGAQGGGQGRPSRHGFGGGRPGRGKKQ